MSVRELVLEELSGRSDKLNNLGTGDTQKEILLVIRILDNAQYDGI